MLAPRRAGSLFELLFDRLLIVRPWFSTGLVWCSVFFVVLFFGCSQDPDGSLATDTAERYIGELPTPPDDDAPSDVMDLNVVEEDETLDAADDAPDEEPEVTVSDMTDSDLIDIDPSEPDILSGESCGDETEQPSDPIATLSFGEFEVIVDEDTGAETHTVEILLDTTVNVHAYEIAVCGVTLEVLDDISGLATANGLGIRTDGIWVAGFGGSSSFIPALSSGVLFTLAFVRDEGAFDVCFIDIGLFDSGGFDHNPISHGPCHVF